jgi:hypothetical protein
MADPRTLSDIECAAAQAQSGIILLKKALRRE